MLGIYKLRITESEGRDVVEIVVINMTGSMAFGEAGAGQHGLEHGAGSGQSVQVSTNPLAPDAECHVHFVSVCQERRQRCLNLR